MGRGSTCGQSPRQSSARSSIQRSNDSPPKPATKWMSVMADASSVRPELFPLTTPWRKSSKSKTNRRARSLAEALGLGQRRSVSRRPADKRRAALKCELRGWHLPPQSHSRAGVAPSMVPPLAETHRRERTHRRMRQMARPVRAPPVPMRTRRRPVLMARREYPPHAARPENHAARRMRVRAAAAASGANAWATAHRAEGEPPAQRDRVEGAERRISRVVTTRCAREAVRLALARGLPLTAGPRPIALPAAIKGSPAA
jgi:hypothetical protein